jgi:hypothetical protein
MSEERVDRRQSKEVLAPPGSASHTPCSKLSSAPVCAMCEQLGFKFQKAALVNRETVQRYREQHWTTPQDCWAAEEALRSTKSAMDQAERSYCEHLSGVDATLFFVYSSILRQPLLTGCTETVHEHIGEVEFRSMRGAVCLGVS